MFGKQKAAPPKGFALHEFVIALDKLIADGRAGRVDVRTMADLLEGRSTALRTAWVCSAPVDASMH